MTAILSPDAFDIEQTACRNDLSYFIEKAFKIVTPGTTYDHNWHIDCMSEYLMACYRRDIKRLIINVPPRSLKSISVSVAFPAWALGHDPTLKFMASSYAEKLAFDHSMDCRRVISDEWYQSCFPNTRIADDQNEKSKFSTTQHGYRIATSVGGRATGMGANFLIVDDCHTPEEALSEQIRSGHLRWFDNTWTSRLNDKKRDVMIVVMQRLHQYDLTGHLLAEGGWEHCCLPVMFEKKKTISIGNFKRDIEAGEYLHPIRFPKEFIEKEKKKSFAYAGQYLQNPVPEGGGIIKNSWVRQWPSDKPLPKFSFIMQSWDTAFTENTSGDPSGCCTFGVFFPDTEVRHDEAMRSTDGFAVMLIDCFTEHLGFPALREKVLEMRKYVYGEQEKRVDLVLVEKKASGQSIIQELRNANLPVKDFNPGREDKTVRLHSVSHLIECGLLWVPESKLRPGEVISWALDYINQLCSFPAALHDEYVDCTTQALRILSNMEFIRADGMADDYEEDDGTDPYAQTNVVNPYGN